MPPILALIALISAGGFLIFAYRWRAQARQTRLELAPVAGVFGLALAALLIENSAGGSFSFTEYITFAAALVLVIGCGVIFWQEGRPHKSRAVWGIGAGLILIVLTVAIPVIAVRVALPAQLSNIDTSESPQTTQQAAADVYRRVLEVIAAETGYNSATISARLDSGDASVAAIVRETDGDLERVVVGITAVMSDAVAGLVLQGSMDENQAAFVISAMETVVRAGVEFDLTNLMARFTEDIALNDG